MRIDVAAQARAVQAWLVVLVAAGSALVVWPQAVEPFMLPKTTAVVVLAVALLVTGIVRMMWRRRLAVPVSTATVAVAVFLLATVAATFTSPTPWASVIGFYGRYSGLVPYLAYGVVFFAVVAVADLPVVRFLSRGLVVAAVPVVGFGLLQAAGADPLGFSDNGLGTTFSTFGNVNFSGAWIGAVLALIVTMAVRETSRGWRATGAVLLPFALGYAIATGTSQAIAVSLVSVLWAAGVLTAGSPSVRRRLREQRGLAAAGAAVAVVATLGAGWAAAPAIRAALDQSLVERPDFWRAALAIWRDNPVIGTGLDTYAHHFLAYRPAEHALANGIATTDAPHSVPLAMLSNGGLVLSVAYLAVVLAVGVALVRGLRAADAAGRVALAGWGGVWLGYQAQSLVSFDVAPLAVLHWVSAGVIVAVSGRPRRREVTLPGRAAARPVNRRGAPAGPWQVPASTIAAWALVGAVGLTAVWFSLYPLRADVVAASAAPLTQQGRLDEAIARFTRAADLNPAEASYAFLAARAHEAAGRPGEALDWAAEAARRDPGTVQYALFAARQAQAVQARGEADRWYGEAVSRDPKDPPVLVEAAAYHAAMGDRALARSLYERILLLDPGNAAAQRGLESVM